LKRVRLVRQKVREMVDVTVVSATDEPKFLAHHDTCSN